MRDDVIPHSSHFIVVRPFKKRKKELTIPTYWDLYDNHSLMKLHNHQLKTQCIQGKYDLPTYIDKKRVSEQFPEQKCHPIAKKSKSKSQHESLQSVPQGLGGFLTIFLIYP